MQINFLLSIFVEIFPRKNVFRLNNWIRLMDMWRMYNNRHVKSFYGIFLDCNNTSYWMNYKALIFFVKPILYFKLFINFLSSIFLDFKFGWHLLCVIFFIDCSCFTCCNRNLLSLIIPVYNLFHDLFLFYTDGCKSGSH